MDGAATLKARQPMCTGKFAAWHHQFILADVSKKLHRQLLHTIQSQACG